MTAPNAGEASVAIEADLSKFAASLRKEIESAFKGLDFDKLIRESIGDKPIKIPVEPEFKDAPLKDLPKQRAPKTKAPVEIDPLFDAFRAELRRQTAAVAKQVHADIPVDADTEGLRAELGSQLAGIAKQLKLPIPAEPADKAAFQAKLQEQLDEVRASVKAQVKVEPDTSAIPEKVRATPVPKVKAEVDPVLSAFQAQLRSQVTALARTVNAKVPVGADGSRLRAELGAQLAEIERSLKVDVPTEPGDRAEYEAKLKAQLAEVSHRVKQSVPVDVDNKGGVLGGIGGITSKLGDLVKSVPGLGLVSSGLGNISEGLSSIVGLAGNAGGSLASLGEAAGPIGLIVGGLAAVAAGAGAFGAAIVGAVTFAIPAITALAGAIASIPALLAGAGAGIGTLFLGFKGISEAFKPKTGGGGSAGQSAAQQARQVAAASRQVEAARRGIVAANRAYEASERSLAAAERGVATAQRNLVDAENAVAAAQKKAQQAQQAVNKAREEAADDLIDLNLQLKDSRLSEEEASLAVTDALRELNAVKLTGNIPDIQKADLAYQRAQLTLEEATQSTKELGKQTAEANAKGVEGSDKVQSALQEQADALDGVKKAQEGVLDAQNGILDAADSLKSAQDGVASAADGIKSATDSLASAQDSLAQAQTKQAASAAAVAQKLIPLAPAAQRFVDAIKALKPAFEDLRLDVQQRLFAGLDKTVTHLGEAWIPALKTTLGRYADTFNGFFRNLGASITTPKFISDIQTGAEGARQLLEKVGKAITDHLVSAFGDLSAAASPFLSHLGDLLANVVTKFSDWVESGAKSGKLADFFDRASKAMSDIFAIGGTVGSIIGSLFEIITGSAPGTGQKSPLESFRDGLQKIADYLADPTNQKKIQDFIKSIEDAVTKAFDLANKVAGLFSTIRNVLGGDNNSLWADVGAGIITGIVAGIELETQLLFSFLGGLWHAVIDFVKGQLGIHSPSTVFADIGGNLIEGLIEGMLAKLGDLLAAAGQLPGVVVGAVGDAATWLAAHGKNAVIGLVNGIGSEFSLLSTRAGQIRSTVQNTLRDAGSWLSAHGQNAVIGFINGIGARLGQVGTAARNIAAYAVNALGSVYNSMLSIGSNVVIGLYNGIAGMDSWLYNKLVSFARAVIPGPIAAALGIASPSKVAAQLGAYVSQGLALGITSEGDRVQAAADEIAAKAVPQIPDVTMGLGAMADAKLSASLQASSQQQLQISWNTGATVDPVLRAFQQLINVQYQGNVQRALTGS